MNTKSFSPEELRRLERALKSGAGLSCPACGATLDRRAVPPREDVSYVRDRVWVNCAGCHRSGVLDRKAPS